MSNQKIEDKIEMVEEVILGVIEHSLLEHVSGGAEMCQYSCSLLQGQEKCQIDFPVLPPNLEA